LSYLLPWEPNSLTATQSLLLDFDGTLVDSLGPLRAAYGHFLRKYGRVPTDAEFEEINGPPLSVGVEILIKKHNLVAGKSVLLEAYLEFVAIAYDQVPPARGAKELLAGVRSRGWATAVVTSNTKSTTENWLRKWNLNTSIDVVVGGDSVLNGKPSPAPYLMALDLLGISADFSRAVEDSATGIRAATQAGIGTWALDPTGLLPKDVLGLPFVVGIAKNLEEVARKIL